MEINQQVINGIKRRSEQAFRLVYDKYYKLIKHIIYKMVANNEVADDLTQETFMKMYERIETYVEHTNFKFWLIAIGKNLTLDYLRKESKQLNVTVDEALIESTLDDTREPDFDPLYTKIRNIVGNDAYDIVILRIFHNQKFQDIATLLDTTTSSVSNKYARAISKLKRELREEDFHEQKN